mgnify:CR=1 FL=1
MKNSIMLYNFFDDYLFENLNILVPKDNFITISGPNNCGKTTLLRILNREIITENKVIIENRGINNYKIEEYSKIVSCVIPLETILEEETVEEELLRIDNKIDKIVKGLKITKLLNKNTNNLSDKEIVLIQIAKALLNKPEILLLDDISLYFNNKEKKDIFLFLRKQKITIVYTTISLEDALYSDYIYIIGDKKVALEGNPLYILQKDNIINKIGLKLPFMIDLSVKLKDYELIDKQILEPKEMVEELWK